VVYFYSLQRIRLAVSLTAPLYRKGLPVKYTATFYGRKLGSIGSFGHPFTEQVEADSEDQARLKLYDKYQDISGLKFTHRPELVTLYVSVYGDGALLDANTTSPYDLRIDEESGDDDTPNETAKLELLDVPEGIAKRAMAYVNGNTGPNPYSDGYEAMECVTLAKTVNVIECSVNRPDGWTHATCKRLGGCYLCGGMHEE
jgi:hypothetical protein